MGYLEKLSISSSEPIPRVKPIEFLREITRNGYALNHHTWLSALRFLVRSYTNELKDTGTVVVRNRQYTLEDVWSNNGLGTLAIIAVRYDFRGEILIELVGKTLLKRSQTGIISLKELIEDIQKSMDEYERVKLEYDVDELWKAGCQNVTTDEFLAMGKAKRYDRNISPRPSFYHLRKLVGMLN